MIETPYLRTFDVFSSRPTGVALVALPFWVVRKPGQDRDLTPPSNQPLHQSRGVGSIARLFWSEVKPYGQQVRIVCVHPSNVRRWVSSHGTGPPGGLNLCTSNATSHPWCLRYRAHRRGRTSATWRLATPMKSHRRLQSLLDHLRDSPLRRWNNSLS